MYFCDYPSALGMIRLTSDGTTLTGCYFHGQKYFPAPEAEQNQQDNLAIFKEAGERLEHYFATGVLQANIVLQPKGTPFQQKVWQQLQLIPQGTTTTYGEVASACASPQSVRAVAGAIGRNPVSLFIPCHRVVGKDGSLTGYAGGIERKQHLLKLEGAI